MLLFLFWIITNTFANNTALAPYTEENNAHVSFDISMPIDATGYTLYGRNLTGGNIQFTDRGNPIAP